MRSANALQIRVSRMDRRLYAVLVGASIAGASAGIGLLLAVAGPVVAAAALIGGLAALYVLTSLQAALYGIVAIMALLPFGTFPFRIGFTPTLLDAAFGGFLVVYLALFMTGRRRGITFTPVHTVVALYIIWLILAFVLGLRWARPTSADLRQFAETLLSISMVFILTDVLRQPAMLRRLVLMLIVAAGTQAAVTLGLYVLNDQTAENLLVRLSRIGYPNGGVIRYIEDNPALAERAIGTWVDPNALGGYLAVSAALLAPQIFARRPVLRPRWLLWLLFGIVGLALVLTYSRASLLAFAVALAFVGLFPGYRRFLVLLAAGAVLLFVLPQTQELVTRLLDAFAARDLATQMRLGEYGDSLELIAQYPIAGVGFTGSPSIALYTDVASMYLIMANMIGLVGVAIFLSTMAAVFAYALRARRRAAQVQALWPVYLGSMAALLTALINGVADLYFFRTDFHASITLFWLVVAVAVAAGRLARTAPTDG